MDRWKLVLACSGMGVVAVWMLYRWLNDTTALGRPDVALGVEQLIGNTPLLRLRSLCEQTGCEILAKAEHMNPGGSPKDRVALQIIRDAEAAGTLLPGGCLVEGTSGSTGISLAMLARALGYQCHVVMPDDQALEKQHVLRHFGATVQLVKPLSIVNAGHYVNAARTFTERWNARWRRGTGASAVAPGKCDDNDDDSSPPPRAPAVFCDQFENLSNFHAHERGTAPEIWRQTRGKIDAFVCGAGTGGTLAGVSTFLKRHRASVVCALVDPRGSSLFNKVTFGVAFAPQQAERSLRRHRYDTIIEGVGVDRVTANFSAGEACIDAAFRCSDAEAVEMSRYLLRHDGVFIGSSSAMNCVGAVKLALRLGPGHTVVTVLCDSGLRHLSRFWNDDYLRERDLVPTHVTHDLSFIEPS